MDPSRRRLLVAALATVVPVVVLAVVAPAVVTPYFLGMLPTVVAGVASLRRAWLLAGLTGALALVAPLAGAQVWSAVVLMTLVAAALGLAAGRGWSSGGAPAAVTLAALTVSPPALVDADPRTLAGAWPLAAAVLAGGVVTALVLTLLSRGVPRPVHDPLTGPELRFYVSALVVVTAVGTWWATTWFPDTHSWWLLLTFYLVMVPRTGDITARALARAGGTVLGGLVVVVLVALDVAPQAMSLVVAVGVVGSVVTMLTAPYWVYTIFLTLTVVGTTTGDAPVAGALERVGLTLLGAGSAAGILLLARLLSHRSGRRADRPAGRPAGQDAVPAGSGDAGGAQQRTDRERRPQGERAADDDP
ncbi:FUSC family protein [Isoptericola haloaureus]|uniref:FUSC family protein n=1 Tax=Isoptericola haloaureus TaxID=1542902 RepID=A0ABU7ZAA1_9MICO